MNDKEKLISLLILADPNPYICESESGSCELTTCTECRARSTADMLIENDFLPVVRCEKCKHAVWDEETKLWKCVESAEYDEESGVWFGFCEYHYGDYFCSCGERKDGDGNG